MRGSEAPASGSTRVLWSDHDQVRLITIHRPEKRNALDRATQLELCDALALSDQDRAVRAVVLTGADPAFCAGNDFTDAAQYGDRYAKQFWNHPAAALRAMLTPVIAAVNGSCISGGLELALSASFIISSERATFADTHARLDVVPTWGLSALLPQAVGIRLAREMSVTGRVLDADEALRSGLVTRVVPHDDLVPFAVQAADAVPATSAVRDVLRLYQRQERALTAAHLAMESDVALGRPFDSDAFASAGKGRTPR